VPRKAKRKTPVLPVQGEHKIGTGRIYLFLLNIFYYSKINERLMGRTGKSWWAVMA